MLPSLAVLSTWENPHGIVQTSLALFVPHCSLPGVFSLFVHVYKVHSRDQRILVAKVYGLEKRRPSARKSAQESLSPLLPFHHTLPTLTCKIPCTLLVTQVPRFESSPSLEQKTVIWSRVPVASDSRLGVFVLTLGSTVK